MNQFKIIKNKAQCKLCFAIIESRHVHDFVSCDCFNESQGTMGISIDGGHEYLKRSGNPNVFNDLSEWTDIVNGI